MAGFQDLLVHTFSGQLYKTSIPETQLFQKGSAAQSIQVGLGREQGGWKKVRGTKNELEKKKKRKERESCAEFKQNIPRRY